MIRREQAAQRNSTAPRGWALPGRGTGCHAAGCRHRKIRKRARDDAGLPMGNKAKQKPHKYLTMKCRNPDLGKISFRCSRENKEQASDMFKVLYRQ